MCKSIRSWLKFSKTPDKNLFRLARQYKFRWISVLAVVTGFEFFVLFIHLLFILISLLLIPFSRIALDVMHLAKYISEENGLYCYNTCLKAKHGEHISQFVLNVLFGFCVFRGTSYMLCNFYIFFFSMQSYFAWIYDRLVAILNIWINDDIFCQNKYKKIIIFFWFVSIEFG